MAFKDLGGRTVLITGAARGIGKATAAAFLDAGATVVLADLDGDAVAAAATDLAGRGRTSSETLDVRDAQAFDGAVARVEGTVGPLDVLVNNAGIMPVGPFLDLPPEVDRKQLDINLHGVANGMRAALPRMERRRRGHIVNIASVAGKIGTPHIAMYSATKHAVVGLTEAVRAEMWGTGVDFSYVLPVLVDTELISGTGRPLFPTSSPDKVAAAVVDAVRRNKVDVYVPRIARLSAILPAITPRRLYEAIGRRMHIDDMFSRVDATARAAYRARVLAE